MIADLGEHYRIEVPTLVVAESELPYGMIALRSHVPRSLKTFTTDQPTLLFLTSGLLKIVSREEKKAILAHEMRHAASFYTPDERDEPKPSQEPPPKPDPQADREFEEKADIASAVLVSPEAASCALTRLYRAHRTYMERRYSWWQRTLMNLTRSHDTHGTLEERIATMERFRAR